MTASDMVRELCRKQNISISELARNMGQSPQNFNKKLHRGTVSFDEMVVIANVLDVKYVQMFMLADGTKIGIEPYE